jgi:hypothetical protein
MVVDPKKFEVDIVPRDQMRRMYVEMMWVDAEKELDEEGQF